MWNQFESSASDEETFSNVLCTNGLFKISSSEPVTQSPRIQSSIQNQRILLAIDQSLIIVENENHAECNFLNFGTKIDCMILSESGNLIICAINNGNIHGVFIKGIPVFNLIIDNEDIREDQTFVGIQYHGGSYYIICVSGSIYRLSNIDEKPLSDTIGDIDVQETCVFDETLLADTVLERIMKRELTMELNTCSYSTTQTNKNNSIMFIAANKTSLYFFDDVYCNILIPEAIGTIKKILNLDSRLIGLSDHGTLFEICQYTMLVFPLPTIENIFIEDLIVLENNDSEIEFLMLVRSKNSDYHALKIVEFPSMRCTYELPSTAKSWLVNQSKSAVNMYYISGKVNDDEVVQEIEIKIISEMQPDQRYRKLIKKGCLDEAESFALQFGLSVQPIIEEKIKRNIAGFQTIKNPDVLDKLFNKLLELIGTVEDKSFLLHLKTTEVPEREMLSNLLKLLRDLLTADETNDFTRDIEDINERLLRLETLKIIDPYECDMEWHKFVHHNNMISVCKEMLNNDICNACIVWARHSSTIVPYLRKDSVKTILGAIPTRTLPFQLILWMRHFVPSILYNHPDLMADLVQWSLEQTKNLQSSNLWPEIGLEFVTNIATIFGDVNFVFVDIRRQYDNNMEKINYLIKTLENLTTLKTQYNLVIPFEKCASYSMEEIAFHLLQKVQINYMADLVNVFIFNNLNSLGIPMIPILIKYIHFLTKNYKQIFSWQERAVTIIGLIHNEQEKLECVLQVLKSAPVPWTDTIKPLLRYGNSNHPLAAEINIQHKWEIIKLIKVKYGWAADCNGPNMMLIQRIVKLNLPDMITDIQTVINTVPNLGTQANFYCCYEFVKRGELEVAIKYLNGLEKDAKIRCAEMTVNIITRMVDDNLIEECHTPSFIEYLKLLNSQRIAPSVSNSFEEQINEIKKLLILRQQFQLEISLECLTISSYKTDFLRLGIENVMDGLRTDQSDNLLDVVWTKINCLSHCLNIDPILAFLEIAKHLDNIYFTCNFVATILEISTINTYNLTHALEFAALLIVQQCDMSLNQNGSAQKHFDLGDALAFPIAYQLLSRIISINVDRTNYLEINEFLRWTRLGNSLYEIDVVDEKMMALKTMGNKAIKEMIEPQITEAVSNKKAKKRDSMSVFERVDENNDQNGLSNTDPEMILQCLAISLKVIIYVLKLDTSPFNRMKNLMKEDAEEIVNHHLVDEFIESINQLMKIKQHSIAFRILQIVIKYSHKSGKLILDDNFINLINRKIIKYCLSQRELTQFDFLDIILMIVSNEKLENLLVSNAKELKTDIQKQNYAMLIEIYYNIKGDKNHAIVAHENRIKNYYYTELCKSNWTANNEKSLDFVSISKFMADLRHKIVDVGLLKKLSKDFNWDYQKVLVTQITTIIDIQELEYKVMMDIFGKEQIEVFTSDEIIFNLCQPYLDEITHTQLLAETLKPMIKQISFYFYELYMVIIRILSLIEHLPNEMRLWNEILSFLKHKMVVKRRNQPSQIENDFWMQTDRGILPKVARYRFPFLPLVEDSFKTILDDEVSVENCHKWFPLIRMIANLQQKDSKTEQEYFCMSAVKNSISDYKGACDTLDIDKWHLKPINNAFLHSIIQLTQHMSNASKIISILYYVTNRAPNGADQVEAAHECYKFAVAHEHELNEKSLEIATNIKRKYPIFKTQHLLHLHSITDDCFHQLVENPNDLIDALYNDDSILQPNPPNINKIAEEIAKYHNLPFNDIQIQLLQKWLSLSPNLNETQLEETFCDDMQTGLSTGEDDDAINQDHILRAYYILKSWETDKAIKFLISSIYGCSSSSLITEQLHRIECLTKLINETSECYADIINQKDYIILKCVHSLKQLGYKFTVKKFTDCDKIQFLKQSWPTLAKESRGLEVISTICIGFEIFEPKIWNGILKQMVALNMVQSLSSLVGLISTKSALLHIDGLTKAWECVIKSTFKDAHRKRSDIQETTLCKALVLLQTCPITSTINLFGIAEECIRLDRPHMAAILISFASNDVKANIMKLVKKHKTDNLKSDIIELEEFGVIPMITKSVIHQLEL